MARFGSSSMALFRSSIARRYWPRRTRTPPRSLYPAGSSGQRRIASVEVRQRPVVLAPPREQGAAKAIAAGEARIDLHGTVEIGQRSLVLPHLGEQLAAAAVGAREARAQANGLVVIGEGRLVAGRARRRRRRGRCRHWDRRGSIAIALSYSSIASSFRPSR